MHVVERFVPRVVNANRRLGTGYVLDEAEQVLCAVRTGDPLADRANHDTPGLQAIDCVVNAVVCGKVHCGDTSADVV